MRLNHDPGAGMLARAAVRDLLADHQTTDELRHDAALVVYELVANAVLHGRPESDGRISLDCQVRGDELVVVVTDGGTDGEVRMGDLDRDAPRGRGLAIVDALASSWSVDRSDGTVVRAVVPLRWPVAVEDGAETERAG
ncbi:ATP-binding protein [Nocardioides anomalus]|uniref:ATP-binding protein n=1 Tax=Nocardioides anomalus TaxID=2712223 RepID=A0A6G6WEP3_9ACTN|nr:ATP-binding protein [Nocardioides anomalus]QIG43798.1 ATP-binding protein [Nocardioides anomalus]